MIKIHFLGTCSGTEPMEGMKHTSIVFEINGLYYWFDAGEGCSRTAHLSGIDLLKVKSIFVSHPHFDHIGGLGGLMWNMRKLTLRMPDRRPPDNEVNLYVPDMESWEGIFTMLKCTEKGFDCEYDINVNKVCEGKVYSDKNITVYAYHNNHLGENDKRSFTYRIEAENKSVVFSGDVKTVHDADQAIVDGCDIFVMETGHHSMEDIIDFVNQKNIGTLVFTHHGRFIINNRPEAEGKLNLCNKKAVIANDGMIMEV